jgi:hypothetical protein
VLPDLDVGVASSYSGQQLLRGAHGSDLGGGLLQIAADHWTQGMTLHTFTEGAQVY